MDYKKKLKQRLYVHLGWAGIGALFILFWCIRQPENTYPLSLGIAFVLMGIIRTVQYRQAMKDEQALRQKELAETDERNLMMSERAKSWAFSISVFIAGDLAIILSLLGKQDLALLFAWFLCGMTLLYWICWNIIRKKY
ncbi:MAG: hypothetical protein IJN67_07395 [Oscillospiraceae bacterium]|nr:hypothetical protein [Oscillospiraceae bacterium]